jgi:hypothetical protein
MSNYMISFTAIIITRLLSFSTRISSFLSPALHAEHADNWDGLIHFLSCAIPPFTPCFFLSAHRARLAASPAKWTGVYCSKRYRRHCPHCHHFICASNDEIWASAERHVPFKSGSGHPASHHHTPNMFPLQGKVPYPVTSKSPVVQRWGAFTS